MRALLAGLLVLAAEGVPAVDEGSKDRASGAGPSGAVGAAPEPSRASGRAIDEGLAFLARAQAATGDGSFSLQDARDKAPVGVTSLAALAFMATGNAPGRGPHGEVVSAAIEYLLQHCDLSPESSVHGYISAQGDTVSQTHGHGYATLALAEAYGMSSGAERIRTALIAAVERIEHSQGAEGGWEYKPFPVSQHENSVTICLVQALRAARDSGIQVDPQVIQRADDYVRRCQKPDGTFRYQLGDDRSSIALTAAAISTLNMTGSYDDAAIQNGIDAIWSGLALQEESGHEADFPEYQRLYLAQALWQLSDETHFQRWFEPERERILRTQEADGSWRGVRFGDSYATAVNCLVLSIPEGVLPIFQR